MSLLSYQHEDQGYPSEGAVAAAQGSSLDPVVPGVHVRLAAARALAGSMKEGGQSTAVKSPPSSSLSTADVIHKIQTLFLASQPSSSSKSGGGKTSAPSSSSSLGSSSALISSKPVSRGVPLTSGSGIGPAAMGFATTAKKPTSGGLGALGAMMGGIGQPPKPKPKTSGLGLGLGSMTGPGPARSGGLSTGSTPTSGTASVAGLGLTVTGGPSPGPGAGAGAGAVSDPPGKVATRLAVAEWLRAVGEQKALPDDDEAGDSSAASAANRDPQSQQHPSLALLAFVLAFGAVDLASEVRRAMLTAGTTLVDAYGARHCRDIIAHLEGVLSATSSSNKGGKKDSYDLVSESAGVGSGAGLGSGPSDVVSSDYRRQACVVLMGAAGRHLAPGDPAITSIAETLVAALSTPSEMVQRAVADCLVLLVQVH